MDSPRLLASLAAVVDFCLSGPEALTLWANSCFAADQLPVRFAALLALVITAEPWFSCFIRVLP